MYYIYYIISSRSSSCYWLVFFLSRLFCLLVISGKLALKRRQLWLTHSCPSCRLGGRDGAHGRHSAHDLPSCCLVTFTESTCVRSDVQWRPARCLRSRSTEVMCQARILPPDGLESSKAVRCQPMSPRKVVEAWWGCVYFQSCCNDIPPRVWLEQSEICALTILETQSARSSSGCSQFLLTA